MHDVRTQSVLRGMQLHLATLADLPVLARIHKVAYSRSYFTGLLSDQALITYYGHSYLMVHK